MIRLSAQILGLLLLALTACSGTNSKLPAELAAIEDPQLEIDILAARGYLGGNQFERYHLKDRTLWRECGSISKRRTARNEIRGDVVLGNDPNLEISERRVDTVRSSSRQHVIGRTAQVEQELSQTSANKIPLPGSVFSITGPGVFELVIKRGSEEERFVTALDAVSDAATPLLRSTKELFETVRAFGPVICDTQRFFGVGRASL